MEKKDRVKLKYYVKNSYKYSRQAHLGHLSFSTSSHHRTDDYRKEDLQCFICNHQAQNAKLLEIHMGPCYKRNKHLFKNISEFTSKWSRLNLASERNIDNYDSASVNYTGDKNSLVHKRKKVVSMSDSQKPREVKLKMNAVKHQGSEKQSQCKNPKISGRKTTMTRQNQVGVKHLRELHHPPGKLCQNSRRNASQQKKEANEEAPSGKFKNNQSQKPNLKTSRQVEERFKQASKKSNQLPSKNSAMNKTIKLKLLFSLTPEKDSGLLLLLPSTNKIGHFYKCCRCGKTFNGIKLASMHYSKCKSTKLINTEVPAGDVRWVCLICHTLFLQTNKLLNHLKGCKIFTKNYERACEKLCAKCHFRCISSFLFQKHDCEKELENMKGCAVKLNLVKMNPALERVIMRECEFCGEIFDEKITDLHFQSHHPGEPSSGNFKQYYVNLNPKPSSGSKVVIKTEPVSPIHEHSSSVLEELEDYLHGDGNPSNPELANIPMPSSPVNLHALLSSAHQSSSAQVGEPSCTYQKVSSVINRQICKCPYPNVDIDKKPCLKCLSKLDVSKFVQNFNIIPLSLAKIKREMSDEPGTSNSSAQADVSTTQNKKQVVGINSGELLSLYSLTPPSSHGGISPPTTPSALVHSLTNIEPCTSSDGGIASLNDALLVVPDISQLDEPHSPDELIEYINDDCSTGIRLSCGDDQELLIPIESFKIVYVREVEDSDTIDAWAVFSSKDEETIEKYICSGCLCFSCLDQDTIIKHLYKNHEKKLQFLIMYIIKSEND